MIGPTSSRAASIAAWNGALPVVQMPLDVLHHHDRVVDHQADREHDREQRQQVDREAGHQHQEDRADERDRNRDDRDDHRARNDPRNRKMTTMTMSSVSVSVAEHFVDRVLDVFGRVVRNADLHPGRQLRLDRRDASPDLLDHVERVGRRAAPRRP